MTKPEFGDLFLATLGMFNIDPAAQSKIGAADIHTQFEHVLEARELCKETYNEKGPKYVPGKTPQQYK